MSEGDMRGGGRGGRKKVSLPSPKSRTVKERKEELSLFLWDTSLSG